MATNAQIFTLQSGQVIPLTEATAAATTIQAAWRGRPVRQKLANEVPSHESALDNTATKLAEKIMAEAKTEVNAERAEAQVAASLALQVRGGFTTAPHDLRESLGISTYGLDAQLSQALLRMQQGTTQPGALDASNGIGRSAVVLDQSALLARQGSLGKTISLQTFIESGLTALLDKTRQVQDLTARLEALKAENESYATACHEVQARYNEATQREQGSQQEIAKLHAAYQQAQEEHDESLKEQGELLTQLRGHIADLERNLEAAQEEHNLSSEELGQLAARIRYHVLQMETEEGTGFEEHTPRIIGLMDVLNEANWDYQTQLEVDVNKVKLSLERTLREMGDECAKSKRELETAKTTSLLADTQRIAQLERELNEANETSLPKDLTTINDLTQRVAELELDQNAAPEQLQAAPVRHGPTRCQQLGTFMLGMTATALGAAAVAMSNPALIQSLLQTAGVCQEDTGWF